jgi:hypothetical protein
MYTPFRLNPRIFPAVVSATVAASEAMTVLCPQTPAADFVFLSASGVASANAVAGKITEPANPAPRVAIAPIKERRSLNADPDSRLSRFFSAIPTPMNSCLLNFSGCGLFSGGQNEVAGRRPVRHLDANQVLVAGQFGASPSITPF